MLVFLGIFLLAFTGAVWSDDCTDPPVTSCCESCDTSESDESGDTDKFHRCCSRNETYTDCVPVQGTCENFDPITTDTDSPCRPGCACKRGYVRAKGGRCIKRNDCPGCGCKEGEVCLNCPRPMICQPSCQEPVPPICDFYPCVTGCECEPGLLRDENGNCVEPSCCPVTTTPSTTDC